MNWIYACIAATIIGFSGGYYTKTEFDKADIVSQVEKARTETATSIKDSLQESNKIALAVETTNRKVDATKKTVVARIQKQENDIRINHQHAIDAAKQSVACTAPADSGDGVYRLPLADVGMLNSARSDAPASAASNGYAESEAPSTVTPSTLADDSLEITKLYRELATNHDALVDYVNSVINKQK